MVIQALARQDRI